MNKTNIELDELRKRDREDKVQIVDSYLIITTEFDTNNPTFSDIETDVEKKVIIQKLKRKEE